MEQLLNHLINDHARDRITFIKGPEGHSETEERLAVYREFLLKTDLNMSGI